MSQTRKGCLGFILFFLVIAIMPIGWRMLVHKQTQAMIYDVDNVPWRPVAVVYGAAIFRENQLSSILRDRMDTAIHLYEEEIVTAILVSGARQDESYDEARSMADYARAHGVPDEDIIIDQAGNRTYDTCYRARNTFNLESAILVTQEFHLPRALFTCNQIGLESIGVVADRRTYRGSKWYNFRETAATLIALYDVVRQTPPAITKITPDSLAH